MLISTAFLIILVSTLYTINAGVVGTMETAVLPTDDHEVAHKLNASHKLNTIEHKLSMIDTKIQHLNEQAHTWAIFRHHIDAWNDQMKAIEHKLDLVKRSQDEHQSIATKLTSFEFTLNHILSRLVRETPPEQHERCQTESLHDNRDEQKWRSEMGTRLSNILRHVQNIENDNQSRQHKKKADNLMAPLREHKHKHHSEGLVVTPDFERLLRSVDQKLTLFSQSFTPKEFRQMHALAKKNGKTLDSILQFVGNTDKRLIDWSSELNENMQQCQEISNELTTFTASSDLLLKKIELLVHKVNDKMYHVNGTCRGQRDDDHVVAVAEDDTRIVEPTQRDDNDEIDEVEENADDSSTDENMAEEEESSLPPAVENSDTVVYVSAAKTGCHELHDSATKVDGVYRFGTPQLNEAARDFNEKYCVQIADDRVPWTVIQNRGPYSEQENFNRSWADYRNGFGDLQRDFWFGNEFIHQLVYADDYQLRVELEDFEGQHAWAEYTLFRVDSERYNYNLLIDGYHGNVADALHYNNEMDFSTFDRRNDRSVDGCCSCATGYASGWWFDNCSHANLNGVYRETASGHNYVGVMWELWHGDYSLKRARMMIRPTRFGAGGAKQHAAVDEENYNEDP